MGVFKAMKILFESYGCTLNKGEAEEIKEALIADGQTIVEPNEDFNRVVLFTCCVIETTQLKMMKRINELADANKEIAVCGCLGAVFESQILKVAPNAMIFPPQLSQAAIKASLCGDPRSPTAQFVQPARPPALPSQQLVQQPQQQTQPAYQQPVQQQPQQTQLDGDAIGILPIATGCLGHCTYCITRRARGPLRSRPISAILDRAGKLVGAGCAELRLTAQDTGIFGIDTGTDLPELLNSLTALKGDFMVRVGMMTPNSALQNLDALVSAFKSPKIFKFLHLPVQSGDDRTLKAMGREYTTAEFRTVVEAFRNAEPDISLSTDIIVGFPGETDTQFELSLSMIKKIKPDIVNVTRFSSRPGTEAEMLADQVPGWAAKERSRILTDLRFEVTGQNYSKFIGRELDVLATENRKPGTTFFRTREYKPVVVNGDHQLGKWHRVRITGHEKTHLAGELISVKGQELPGL